MIELKRILADRKLARSSIENLQPNEELVAHCSPNANDWKAAEKLAYNVRKDYVRPDGLTYDITSSSTDMTVRIKLVQL